MDNSEQNNLFDQYNNTIADFLNNKPVDKEKLKEAVTFIYTALRFEENRALIVASLLSLPIDSNDKLESIVEGLGIDSSSQSFIPE